MIHQHADPLRAVAYQQVRNRGVLRVGLAVDDHRHRVVAPHVEVPELGAPAGLLEPGDLLALPVEAHAVVARELHQPRLAAHAHARARDAREHASALRVLETQRAVGVEADAVRGGAGERVVMHAQQARIERPTRVVAELDVEHVLAEVAHAGLQRRGVAQLQRVAGVAGGEAEVGRVADLLEVHAGILAARKLPAV